MSQFTDRMENMACGIAKIMERTSRRGWRSRIGDRSNVKPWYSSRAAFVPGVDVVLIGDNPGGSADAPPNDAKIESYQRDLNRPGFNAYLDESWDSARPGSSKLQRGVRMVFSTLYGGSANGDDALRKSVCFNVCPLRTSDMSQLPPEVLSKSVRWCRELLQHLKPSLIICNGISDSSPWAAMGSSLHQRDSERLGRTYVRYGIIASGDLQGTKVLGIPHLSRFGLWRTTPSAIARIARDHNIP